MFRKIIQREAKRKGLSGYRLGQLAGIPIRTVQGYLAGDADLTGERLAKIADALELELRPKRRRAAKG